MAPSVVDAAVSTAGESINASKSTSNTNKAGTPSQVQSLGKTKDGRTLKIRSYPKFENLEDERQYRKQHLAAAFRVFADRGFDEGVAGHISVRDPILTDHFCKLLDKSLSTIFASLTRYRDQPSVCPFFSHQGIGLNPSR